MLHWGSRCILIFHLEHLETKRLNVVVRPAPVVREAVVVRPLHHYARPRVGIGAAGVCSIWGRHGSINPAGRVRGRNDMGRQIGYLFEERQPPTRALLVALADFIYAKRRR
jgi:hypothetical protein